MKSQKTIKDIITSLNKQPVLFIGSGFSKRYLGLENWEELLKKFISDISDDEFKYEMYANKISEEDYYGKQAAIAKLLEKDEINLDDLENYLKNIITQNLVSIKNNSELKRLIRIYDFLKFRK